MPIIFLLQPQLHINSIGGTLIMKTVTDPFFSVIIPCYNSKATIGRLLKSIVSQNMSDEIEVILSDDHSTESYEEEVAPYYDKLCIKKITTDYNCCPGNTREKGVTIATGEWIMFADHDDMFLPKTFRQMKVELLKHNEKYIGYCNIYRAKNTDKDKFDESLTELKINSFSLLLHGKVFNRENLWEAYGVHFKKDLFTHEDTFVITVIKCILEHLKVKPLHMDFYNYVWFNNSESLSNSGGMYNFLEKNFDCYVSTADVYRAYYNNKLIDDNFTVYSLLQMIMYEYFYMQMFIFRDPEGYMKENIAVCREDLVKLKKQFNLSNNAIFWYAGQDNARLYRTALMETGFGFVPNHSLPEWLNILDPD